MVPQQLSQCTRKSERGVRHPDRIDGSRKDVQTLVCIYMCYVEQFTFYFRMTPNSKRKRDDEGEEEGKSVVNSATALRTLLSSAISDHASAEIAILHVMEQYDFDLGLLHRS